MSHSTPSSISPARASSDEEHADSQPNTQQQGRRRALRRLGKVGLGAAALSFATFGPAVRDSLAQSTDGPVAILNFALTLEYLESIFYEQGVNTDGLLEGEAAEVYGLIAEHEEKHVAALRAAISDAGGEPVGGEEGFTADDFDFTAGGAVPNPFENYPVYLALSQAFEDTGVRAYKGQAANIPGDLSAAGLNVLTTALQIHSLEARHAAEVRRLRATNGSDVEPWISDPLAGFSRLDLSDAAVGLVEMVYAGEDNLTQGPYDLENQLGDDYTNEELVEAFDEPLGRDDVTAIAAPFAPFLGEDDDDG